MRGAGAAGAAGSGGAWTDPSRSIAIVAKSPPLAGGGGRGEVGRGRGGRPGGESTAGRRRRGGGGRGAAAAAGARRLQARLEALLRLEFASAMADMLYGLSECLFFLHPERPIFNGARFLQVWYCYGSGVLFFGGAGGAFFCDLGREEGWGRGRGWRAGGGTRGERVVWCVCLRVFSSSSLNAASACGVWRHTPCKRASEKRVRCCKLVFLTFQEVWSACCLIGLKVLSRYPETPSLR